MMKKFFKKAMVLLLSLLLMVSFAGTAMAEDGISVMVDGTKLTFDVQPQVINNRVMVPMRAIFEALDASVEYDSATQTISANKDGRKISMGLNGTKMYISFGDIVTLDAPAQAVDGRTMVPLRAISEAFKTTVSWDQSTKTVTIIANNSKTTSNVNSNNSSTDERLVSEANTFNQVTKKFVTAGNYLKLAAETSNLALSKQYFEEYLYNMRLVENDWDTVSEFMKYSGYFNAASGELAEKLDKLVYFPNDDKFDMDVYTNNTKPAYIAVAAECHSILGSAFIKIGDIFAELLGD